MKISKLDIELAVIYVYINYCCCFDLGENSLMYYNNNEEHNLMQSREWETI